MKETSKELDKALEAIQGLQMTNLVLRDRSDYRRIAFKKLHLDAQMPKAAHGPDEDAGFDLFAAEDAILMPGVPQAVPTGIAIELPSGFEAQIRPRSGLALKHGITIPNSPATIDPGYRGEVKAILLWGGYNPNWIDYMLHYGPDSYEHIQSAIDPLQNRARFQHEFYKVCKGDRIAQMVIARYEKVEWVEASELAQSERGAGGFGSTGK